MYPEYLIYKVYLLLTTGRKEKIRRIILYYFSYQRMKTEIMSFFYFKGKVNVISSDASIFIYRVHRYIEYIDI